MFKKKFIDVVIFIDIDSRDADICHYICDELNRKNIHARCFSLKDEARVYNKRNVKLAIINKPHFFMFPRILQKLKGTRFIVLDTEGVLPGQNRQHVLLEPEGYIHWFKHQAERYKFQNTKAVTVGYPRRLFLSKSPKGSQNKNVITVATNFSVLGYTISEVIKRERDRKLKLVNDWSLLEYRKFQEQSLTLLYEIFIENPDKKFIVKPHPNDPKDLWTKLKIPENVEIFEEDVPINNLFLKSPMAHICLDGCTTILDAYLVGVPVITIGKFLPFERSLLRSLLAKENNQDTSLDFTGESDPPDIISTQEYDYKNIGIFKSELQIFSSDELFQLVGTVLNEKPKFLIYDFPVRQHFIYWFKSLIKGVAFQRDHKTGREKFSAK